MIRKLILVTAGVSFATSVNAGGAIGYSKTYASGTVERVVEQRTLADGVIGAMVSYTRSDGSRSFVEYAIRCDPMEFAYLGIVSDDVKRTPNLLTVRTESDRLLSNDLSPVAYIALNEQSGETEVRDLAKALCS